MKSSEGICTSLYCTTHIFRKRAPKKVDCSGLIIPAPELLPLDIFAEQRPAPTNTARQYKSLD